MQLSLLQNHASQTDHAAQKTKQGYQLRIWYLWTYTTSWLTRPNIPAKNKCSHWWFAWINYLNVPASCIIQQNTTPLFFWTSCRGYWPTQTSTCHSPLRSAFWASTVISSASSSMISLKPDLNIVLVLANVKISPLTIPIPLSSDAFNSKTCKTINAKNIEFIHVYHWRKLCWSIQLSGTSQYSAGFTSTGWSVK